MDRDQKDINIDQLQESLRYKDIEIEKLKKKIKSLEKEIDKNKIERGRVIVRL